MQLNFKVEKQRIIQTSNEFLVNKSHNYHIINVEFADDWADYTKFIIIKDNTGEAYLFHHDGTGIELPYTIVSGDRFSISAYGVDTDQNRVTTNEISILLNNAGYTTDISEIPEEEMDIIADIYQKIDTKSDNDHQHLTSDITDFPVLANVATSGSYNDLNNKPTIPTKTSQLQNDSGYLTSHQLLTNYIQKSNTAGLIKNDGTVDTTQYLTEHQDITMKADKTYVDNKIDDIKEYVDETIGNIEEDMLL